MPRRQLLTQQRTDPRRRLAGEAGPVPGDDEQKELAGPTVSVFQMDDQAVSDFLVLVDWPAATSTDSTATASLSGCYATVDRTHRLVAKHATRGTRRP
jgi:hypothetical protein